MTNPGIPINETKKTSPFRYGIGMLGTSIPINMFKSFAAAFYVIQLGLDMELYSTVLLIYTFVDVIDNPIYGFLSDRTNTKWGRRRPWLLIGTPLMVVCFLLFFNVPAAIQSDKSKLYMYMLLTYLLTGTLDSLMNANYGALFPELFKDDSQRAKTNAIRQISQLVAMAISIALTPMVAEKIGYNYTSIVYGALALAVLMYSFTGCHENNVYVSESKPNLIKSIVDLLKNHKFWIYGFAGAFYSAAFSLISQALSFYVKYTLGLGGTETTLVLATVLGVAVIGILMWTLIAKKMHLITIWRIGFLVMFLGFIPLYFADTLGATIAIASVMGLGIAGALSTMDCISAKIIDDDYRKHGIRREGVISSLVGVMNRLNGLYTSLAFFVVARAFGFENGDNPGENPAEASRVLLCVFPAIAMLLAVIFSFFLKFKDEDNSAGTAEQNGKGTVADQSIATQLDETIY